MRRLFITFALTAAAACGSSGTTPGGGDAAAPGDMAGAIADMTMAGPDMTKPHRTLNVQVGDLLDNPVGGVMVSTEEDPSIKATTDSMGNAKLDLPLKQTVTIVATKTGFARTVEQPLQLLKEGAALDFGMVIAAQKDFDAIQAAGGAPSNTALVAIGVNTPMGSTCDVVGVTLGLTPATGKTVYVDGASMTSEKVDPKAMSVANDQSTVQGYVTGVAGKNLTPTGTSAKCKFATFPQTVGDMLIPGPFNAEPGAFHDFVIDLM